MKSHLRPPLPQGCLGLEKLELGLGVHGAPGLAAWRDLARFPAPPWCLLRLAVGRVPLHIEGKVRSNALVRLGTNVSA